MTCEDLFDSSEPSDSLRRARQTFLDDINSSPIDPVALRQLQDEEFVRLNGVFSYR